MTPNDGALYYDEIVLYCLTYHPDLVLWLRGTIPSDIVEADPTVWKKGILEGRGGTYKDEQGKTIDDDMSIVECRANVI